MSDLAKLERGDWERAFELAAYWKEQAERAEARERKAEERERGLKEQLEAAQIRADANWTSVLELTEEAGRAAEQALRLTEQLESAQRELQKRRACLVAARIDFSAIAGASVEDGGLWIRSVAEGRIPYLDQAIANTDAALDDFGIDSEGIDKDDHRHYEPRWNLREIELWMAALGFLPKQQEQLISALGGESSPATPPVISGPMPGHHIPIQSEEWAGSNPASEQEAR